MKKTCILIVSIVISAIAFNGCKKGENDPFITLRSRDGRLMQKWKLTKIEGTDVSVNITAGITSTTTETTTFDGTTYTYNKTTVKSSGTNPPAQNSTSTGSFEITIDKNGKVSWTETATTGGVTSTASGEGHWQWSSANKHRDYLFIDGDGTGLFPGSTSGPIYIERLAGKEMILHDTNKSTTNGDSSTHDFKYTFSKE